jgi:hypothetical protein
MNREKGFCMSKAWKSLICCLNEHKQPPSKDTLWLGLFSLLFPLENALLRSALCFFLSARFFSPCPSACDFKLHCDFFIFLFVYILYFVLFFCYFFIFFPNLSFQCLHMLFTFDFTYCFIIVNIWFFFMSLSSTRPFNDHRISRNCTATIGYGREIKYTMKYKPH